MKKVIGLLVGYFLVSNLAWSFCGFYVDKAGAKLFNRSSQVILARDGRRTVLTMVNDFQGNVKDFAIVVPVPVVLRKDQVHIGDPKIVERLDAFSAPRLVEYFDPDPCAIYELEEKAMRSSAQPGPPRGRADALGVKIEAEFTVGEYDIVILSATQSQGLETWLRESGYRIPRGAHELLRPYIKQNMKFFVARVNLAEYKKSGYSMLRPLMMAYESPKFMLPIRLGMLNASEAQDLVIYVLSPEGRAEITNYRTVKIPSGMDLPLFVRKEFPQFYRAMFQRAYEREGRNVAFVEYAWDMSWCDPCAATPLSREELEKAGVFWLDNGSRSTFVTRLHVRYTRDRFPEDLVFEETPNRENFQGRYVLRHPFKGSVSCDRGKNYWKSVYARQEKEAQALADLTGWDLQGIRKKMSLSAQPPVKWWEKIFK